MEEFLQRTKAKLSRDKHLDKVHVVLGKKSCDLDSLVSTLAFAYYLEKVSPPNILCLPVLNISRRDICYHMKTKFLLEELNIPDPLHIFRDEINLYQLNTEGKLSITLVNSSTLTSEDKSLESAVVRVIIPEEQSDGSPKLPESASSLVAKELLQKTPELITQQLAHLLRGSILSTVMDVDPPEIPPEQEELLSSLEKKFPDLLPRKDMITFLQEAQLHAEELSIEEALIKDLKEVSDGEIKVALSTAYMNLEDCLFHRNIKEDLKAFVDKYGFDVLIISASYLIEGQEKRQIAVYSENMELGNQICCELEECQNPCLELDPMEYGCDQLLIYHQENYIVNGDEIFLLLKDVISRRHPEMAPNSRTSSTEAVAGSAPLSQGSSGIMELYGSDIEPQPNVNFIENPQDHNGSAQIQADVNVDLVSPDSGLATIRSSRSSKESSVFLSDDSPVAEGVASHHSFLSGFDSYSPIPEGAIADEEKPQSRNCSDNFDLFSFDLASMASVHTTSSHSVDCSADDFSHDSGSSEGQLSANSKADDKTNISECDIANCSIDMPVTSEEDDIVLFDENNHQQENHRDFSKKQLSLIDLENELSSSPEILKSAERRTPPTPMNSLVETSPLDSGTPLFYPQDIIKRINEIDNVNSSQSRIRYGSWWDGFELDSKNVDSWNSAEPESVFQSPDSLKDYKANLLHRQQTDRRASDSVCIQKQSKDLDISRAGIWGQLIYKQKYDEQQMEDFANVWNSGQPVSGPWNNREHIQTNPLNVWSEFDHNSSRRTEHAWNVPPVDLDHISQNLDVCAMSKCLPDLSADNPSENSKIQMDLGSKNKEQDASIECHKVYKNSGFDFDIMQKDVNLIVEDRNDTRSSQFDSTAVWDACDSNIRKDLLGNLDSWEDPFLSYRDPDFVTSTTCEDLVVSPPDTNYSTSDSYVSPTGVGDEKESEGKHSDRDRAFDQTLTSNSGESVLADENVLRQTSLVCSPDHRYANSEAWKLPLNNEKQTEFEHSELNIRNTAVFDSEQKRTMLFLGDYDVDDSSPSENCGMMLVSTIKNSSSPLSSFLCTPEEKDERNNEVILEDIETPSLDTKDKENAIFVKDEIKENIQSEHEAKLFHKEFDQKDEHLQHNRYAALEDNNFCSSMLGVNEHKSAVGAVTSDNIQSEAIQKDNMQLQLIFPLSYVKSSEESRTISDYPSSPEKTITSGSLEEVAAELSEVSVPFPNWTHLDNEENKEESSESNAEHSITSPKEDNVNLECFNMIDHSEVVSTQVSKYFDKDLPKQNISDMENASSISPRQESNQSKHSPTMVKNQSITNKSEVKVSKSESSSTPLHSEILLSTGKETVRDWNVYKSDLEPHENISEMIINEVTEVTTSKDVNKERSIAIPQSPYAECIEPPDTTSITKLSNPSPSKADSSKRSEISDCRVTKFTHEKCTDIIPHHELSPVLDAWNISLNEKVQSAGLTPMENEISEGSDTTNISPANSPLKNTSEEDKSSGGSIQDDIYSSPTSPDLSDSSTNMHIWENFQGANQNKNEAEPDVTTNCKIDESGKESLENKSQEESETSTDHKVPKNLDLWNAHVEDDTSSLSGPGTDEDSEYSNIHQEEMESDLEDDRKEGESLQFSETNFTVDSRGSDVQPSLDENVCKDELYTISEDVNACNTLREDCVHETSEYFIKRETDHSDIQDHTTETSTVNHEGVYAPNNSDAWDILLHANPKSTLDENQKSIGEGFGFPDDPSEWWNVEKESNGLLELNSENYLKGTNTIITTDGAWAVDTKRNENVTLPNLSNFAGYEKNATQWNNIGEYKNEEHQHEGPDQGNACFRDCDQLSWPHNDESGAEQGSCLADVEQSVPEDWQTSVLNALMQVDLKHGPLKNHPNILTLNSFESNIIKQYSETQLEASEKSTADPLLALTKYSSSTASGENIGQETSFIPDILQNRNPGDSQIFSIDPDLWADVDQPFILRTSRENPDILSHFEQDNSSQASSSPDICQYESKDTCTQSFVPAEQEELNEMSPILSEDTGFDFNQQLITDREEVFIEENSSCLPNIYEINYQVSLPTSEELSEIGKENIMMESNLRNKRNVELMDLPTSYTESLGLVPLHLENKSTFENKSSEEEKDSASLDRSTMYRDPGVSPVFPTDGFIYDNFPDNDQLSAFDCITGTSDQLATMHSTTDDAGEEQSTKKESVSNNLFMMLNETNPLTVTDESEKTAEIQPTLTKKHSLQASSEEVKKDFLYSIDSQYATNNLQKSKNIQETYSPPFIESPNKQSTPACSPFITSFGLDTPQKGGINISGSNTIDIKDDVAECSQQGWGSLLLESAGTPGSSCTLKGFEFETDSSNFGSPGGGSEMDLSESKATDFKNEVAEDQDSQGWESFLVESDEILQPAHQTRPNPGKPREDESHLSKHESNGASSKVGEGSEDWESLLLESEGTPKLTNYLKGFQYEVESIHMDSSAGGANETVGDVFNYNSKVSKFPERRKRSKEDTQLQEAEERSSLEMDYVLISGEEKVSLTKDILVTQEVNFPSDDAEQMDSPEAFSADCSDTFHSISIINKSKGQSVLENEWDCFYLEEKSSAVVPQKCDNEKKSPSFPVQDQGWTMVGQSRMDDISPEEDCSRQSVAGSPCRQSVEELNQVSSQELISETHADILLENGSHQSREQEDTISHSTRTDALLLQVIANDAELDDHLQQHLGDGIVKKQEMEDETQFVVDKGEFNPTVGLVPEDVGMDISLNEAMLDSSELDMQPEPPNSLDLNGSHPRRIKLTAPNISLSLDQSEGSVLSDDNLDTPDETDINVDELDTPDEADSLEYAGHEEQIPLEKEPFQEESESIPEYTAEEEREDNRLWRTVVIGDQEQRIDMRAIEPYKKVISHGGYYGDGLNAIIVFAACFLPDSSQMDYTYIMENLFLYVISTLELMVAEDYMIIYFNGATPRRRMPGLGWMKRCYQMIDRRLRKNLKSFIIVHPSWFIRTILAVTRPFISSKFSNKIQYVNTLAELNELIPMECVNVPETIVKYDEDRSIQRRVRLDEELREASAKASCLSNDPEISSVQQDINMTMKRDS